MATLSAECGHNAAAFLGEAIRHRSFPVTRSLTRRSNAFLARCIARGRGHTYARSSQYRARALSLRSSFIPGLRESARARRRRRQLRRVGKTVGEYYTSAVCDRGTKAAPLYKLRGHRREKRARVTVNRARTRGRERRRRYSNILTVYIENERTLINLY